MVSREPSKIILYRGRQEQADPIDRKEGDVGRRSDGAVEVSPQLMAAISLECGVSAGQDADLLP